MSGNVNLGRTGKLGTVDFNKFKGGIKQSDFKNPEQIKIFEKLDKDHNGILSQDEIQTMLDNLGNYAEDGKITKKEAKKFIKENGLKGDVKKEQVLEMLKQMGVASENIEKTFNSFWDDGNVRTKNVEYKPNENGEVITEYYDEKTGSLYAKQTVKNNEIYMEKYNEQKEVSEEYTKKSDGTEETITYNELGHVSKQVIKTPDGWTTTRAYDENGDILRTSQKGAVTKYLDDDGKVLKEEIDKGLGGKVVTEYNYDEQGKLTTTKTTNPDGTVVVEVNSDGREIQTSDKDGVKKTVIKDGENTVEIKYDEAGNIISNAKNGETFVQTAKRLGIEQGTPEFEQFTELNAKAAKKGWFQVGAEVKIPAGMEDKLNIAELNVDTKSEQAKFARSASDKVDISVYNNQNTTTKTLESNTTYWDLAKQNLIDTGVESPSNAQISQRMLELQKLNNSKQLVKGAEITVPKTENEEVQQQSPDDVVPAAANDTTAEEVTLPEIIEIKDSNLINLLRGKNGTEVAESLYDDIHQIGTGKDFDEHINDITSSNVVDVWKAYNSKSSGESLVEAIFDEIGMDADKQIASVNHIKDALIQKANSRGVQVEVLTKQFEQEVKDATTGMLAKVGYVDTKKLDAAINTYIARIETMENMSEATVRKNSENLGQTYMDDDIKTGLENNAKNARMSRPDAILGDGVIDKNNGAIQMTGNCWAHSGINALVATPAGKEILNNLITKQNGVIAVKLPEAAQKGLPKPNCDGIYTFTEKELLALGGFTEQSFGDGDVTAVMLAVSQYFRDTGEKSDEANNMDGNIPGRMFEILTGQKHSINTSSSTVQDGISIKLCQGSLKESFYNNILEAFNNNQIAIEVGFKDDTDNKSVASAIVMNLEKTQEMPDNSPLIMSGHAYAVTDMDSENVYLVESNNPEKVIKMSREDFSQTVSNVTTCKL